jgi:integrase
MSVRKRTWTTRKGARNEAWVVDYVDQAGKRHLKTFDRKKEADAYHAHVNVEVSRGEHAPEASSITVAEAGKLWIATAVRNGLERSTIDQYQQHLDLHIVPFLGRVKLAHLTAPLLREFEDQLHADIPAPSEKGGKRRSPAMIKKIMSSLGSVLGDAQERGRVVRNVARDLRGRRKRGKDRRAQRRQKGKLRIGVDIPTVPEIKAIVGALHGRWRPVLMTAIFTGLRASELRGLRWQDVDLANGEIYVRQRADRYNATGAPKSESGERTVPLPPIVTNTLKEWKLVCPRWKENRDDKGELRYVFPTGSGKIESLANIINRGLIPTQRVAGVTRAMLDSRGKARLDGEGNPVVTAKYTGMHSLRHFYASWCINRRKDGGLELPPKLVQERLGHSSIVMTMDVYGHLFPRGDDSTELAEAERALLA